jgi:hypothetical protein
MSDKDILKEAREAYERSAEAERNNRADALDDIRFARLGEQWPANLKKERDDKNRPCLVVNGLPSVIRQVVNDARQNRPSIKVHPVDSAADIATADVMSGLIRNIEVTSDADIAYDTAIDNAVTGGFGYFRISIVDAVGDSFDQDIAFQRIANPFSVYSDPDATSADGSDVNTLFVTDWLMAEDFEAQYKGAEKVDWSGDDYTGLSSEWHEKEGGEQYVRVVEWWKREMVERPIVLLSDRRVMAEKVYALQKDMLDAQGLAVVKRRIIKDYRVIHRLMTGAEILTTTEWAGRSIPVVPVYGDEVNVDGVRHFRSLIRDAKDPQRMFNYWRTLTTEIVALQPKAPFIGPEGFTEAEGEQSKWETANTENHPFLQYKVIPGAAPPQRQGFAGIPAGALQEALTASDDIKRVTGIYDASLGAKSNETSGRAIIARQREGDVSTFHFIDNLARSIRHGGRILIDLIPKVYNQERMMRVLGEDGTPEVVHVNSGQMQRRKDGTEGTFELGAGKYDLTVTAGPSFTTRREEAAVQMTELLRAFPQAAPIIGDLLAKNLDWPGADEIAKRLKMLLPPGIGDDKTEIPAHIQQAIEQGKQMIVALQGQLTEAMQENAALKQKAEVGAAKNEVDREKINVEHRKLDLDEQRLIAETENVRADTERLRNEAVAAQSITASAAAMATAAQQMAAVAQQSAATMPVMERHAERMAASVAEALALASAPRRKSGRAVRQSDGSYALEAVETPAVN